jgi:hypothetical protein
MNYRSVVLFGEGQLVSEKEKHKSLKIISDHILPGRWAEVREPSPKELKATDIISIPIREASAKIRTGPPIDEKADYDLDVWAGEIPLRLSAYTPRTDPRLKGGIPLPDVVKRLFEKYP